MSLRAGKTIAVQVSISTFVEPCAASAVGAGVTSGAAPGVARAGLPLCSCTVLDVLPQGKLLIPKTGVIPEKNGERGKAERWFWVSAWCTVICVVTDLCMVDFNFPNGAVLPAGRPGSRGCAGL